MIYHEHPLRILRYSAKNIWLLVFPLFRGMRVIRLDADRLYQWFRGAWLDIAVIGVIILFGYIRWHFSGIQITDTEIIYREGISAKIRTSVPFENVSSVTVERPFYLVLLRAVKIGCDTSGGISGNADLRLMVTEKFSAEFLRHIPETDDRNKAE
ncbi:MAG: PH domain-containing protein [Ruminococcus sp.]|nr:PH domain-containing protein [Ruminococcus sp.]